MISGDHAATLHPPRACLQSCPQHAHWLRRRPAYLELGRLRRTFPTVPIIAVTATATAAVQGSIAQCLGLDQRNLVLLKESFNRPNLRLIVRHKELIRDGTDDAVLQVAVIRRPKAPHCCSEGSCLARQLEDCRAASHLAFPQDLISFIQGRPEGESGIIYCQLRKTCDTLASQLIDADIDVAAYHAGEPRIQPASRQGLAHHVPAQ